MKRIENQIQDSSLTLAGAWPERQGRSVFQPRVAEGYPSSLLKKPPGEGTGPTMHAVFRGNLVGRVPSRGERHVVQQTARCQGPEFINPNGVESRHGVLGPQPRWGCGFGIRFPKVGAD